MNSDLIFVPLEKKAEKILSLMGFITLKQMLRIATGQANEKRSKIIIADTLGKIVYPVANWYGAKALGVGVDDLIK